MPRKVTNLIIVHCSATPASHTHVDAKEIDGWHRKKGWLKIGYHYVITRDAVVQKGREQEEIGAHAAGFNHESLGVCLVGGTAEDGKTPENNFNSQQMYALHALLLRLRQDYPHARIVGHGELDPKKACPSFSVKYWLTDKPELAVE